MPHYGLVPETNPINWMHPDNRDLRLWLLGVGTRCGGGQWRDLTGRHVGTLINGPTWVPTGRGDLGVDLAPASSQYIDCASVDGQIVGASQVSVSVWVNRTPGTMAMAFRGTNESTGFGIQWFLDNQIYCVADTGSGQAYASVGSGASGWHLVHIAFDGTLSGSDRMRLWLDGERRSLSFVGTMPTAVAAGGAGWAIGGSTSVGYQTGAVADHSVWTGRAWSDADAWSLYAESRQGYPTRLNRWVPPVSRAWVRGGYTPSLPGVLHLPRSNATKPAGFRTLRRGQRLADGLTGAWLFNELVGFAGGLTHDMTGRNHATLTGTGPFFNGFGLTTNGGDSYANAGNAASLNPGTNGAYTLLVGIRTGAIDGTLRNVLFKGDGSAGDIGLLLNFPGAGSWSFQVGSNTFGATTLAANTDYVLGVTYKGGASGPVAVYQNGRLSATGTGSTASKSSRNLTFGADAVNGRYFNGTVKWVLYWNGRALNADDVRAASTGPYMVFNQLNRQLFATIVAPSAELTADSGTYTYVGDNASLIVTRTLSVVAGSYTVVGDNAALQRGFSLSANAGTYTYTGDNASLLAVRTIAADAGTYTVVGDNAALQTARIFAADSGTYTYTGDNASVVATRTLSVAAGSYTVVGDSAALLATRTIAADDGTYTYTGDNASLYKGFALAVDGGVYTLVGQDVTFVVTYSIAANGGVYTYVGDDASLQYGRVLQVDGGVYTIVGDSATLVYSGDVIAGLMSSVSAALTPYTESMSYSYYVVVTVLRPSAEVQ